MIDRITAIFSLEHTCFIYIAGIAQLVERNLAKVEVAGSSPVSRSSSLSGDIAKW